MKRSLAMCYENSSSENSVNHHQIISSNFKMCSTAFLTKLCPNMHLYILSFLEPKDIINYGKTCHELYKISRLPSLWCNIDIKNAEHILLSELYQLISRSCPIYHPLTQLILTSGDDNTMETCHCTLSNETCTHCNNQLNMNGIPPQEQQPLPDISQISSHLRSLQNLQFSQIQCINSLTISSFLRATPNLLSITLANNIDVNLIVQSIALSCCHLLSLSFNYVDVLNFESEESALEYPLLSSESSQKLVKNCSKLKCIRFCHYTIDEDSVQELLNLTEIESADFSDNESLHGEFLLNIPLKWPKLRSLILRDCLGIEDEHVSSFATRLVHGWCPLLSYVDCSCQWSFFNTSLLFKSVRDELDKYRGSYFVDCNTHTSNTQVSKITADVTPTGAIIRWREDQCEMEGFGVDPEDGVDLYNVDTERIRSYSICSNSGINLSENGEVDFKTFLS